jgi:hypothetical protein
MMYRGEPQAFARSIQSIPGIAGRATISQESVTKLDRTSQKR